MEHELFLWNDSGIILMKNDFVFDYLTIYITFHS